jgi:hypothetical protein
VAIPAGAVGVVEAIIAPVSTGAFAAEFAFGDEWDLGGVGIDIGGTKRGDWEALAVDRGLLAGLRLEEFQEGGSELEECEVGLEVGVGGEGGMSGGGGLEARGGGGEGGGEAG